MKVLHVYTLIENISFISLKSKLNTMNDVLIISQKFWRNTLYILSSFPLILIISLLAFYIDAGIYNNFGGISGINPYTFHYYNLYQFFITTSMFFSSLLFLVWVTVVITYIILNTKNIRIKPILITSLIQLIAGLLLFSRIGAFSID